MFSLDKMLSQWLPFRKIFRENLYLNRAPNVNANTKWHLHRLGNNHFLQNSGPYSPTWQETIRNKNPRDWCHRLAESNGQVSGIGVSNSALSAYEFNSGIVPTFHGDASTSNKNYRLLVKGLGEAPLFNTPYVFH